MKFFTLTERFRLQFRVDAFDDSQRELQFALKLVFYEDGEFREECSANSF